MARECGDCYWAQSKVSSVDYSSTWICKKTHRRIELDDRACSEFRSDDTKVCEDCEYFESKWKWSTTGTCTLRGSKRGCDQKACPSYYES